MVFLGVTAAWMLMAERTEAPVSSAKAVIRADLLFTLPGVLLILFVCHGCWGGCSPAVLDNRRPGASLSGVIWVGVLIPVQHRMAVFSDPSDYPDSLPSEFFSALRKWYIWGGLAIALPVCSLYLMVNKPAFG